MASIALDFVPPDEPNIVQMRIYEAPAQAGPFVVIETVPMAYPDYPTRWTTDDATSVNSWISIDFVDDKGAVSEMSVPIQGGTKTLVSEIKDRVLLRSPSTQELIAVQESEASIEAYFKADPYGIDASTVSYQVKSGLTLLALGRSMLYEAISSGETSRWTAGLVTVETGKGQSSITSAQDLIRDAGILLGLTYSVIAQMTDLEIAGGLSRFQRDQSRLLLTEIQ